MTRCLWCDVELAFDALDDDACGSCGEELDDYARHALLIARAVAETVRAAPAPRERRRNTAAGIVSGRAAARRLGIGRDTLARLVEAGVIAPVPKGSRPGFRAADVEALIEKGYTLPDAPPPQKPKRRRTKGNGAGQVKRISDLPY